MEARNVMAEWSNAPASSLPEMIDIGSGAHDNFKSEQE